MNILRRGTSERLVVRNYCPYMKRSSLLATLALTTLLTAPAPLFAQADAKKDAKPEPKKDAKPAKPNPVQAPDVAAPKFRDGEPDGGFIKSHERFVAIAKAGGVDLSKVPLDTPAPELPTSEPAMISMLLLSEKPMPAAAQPE